MRKRDKATLDWAEFNPLRAWRTKHDLSRRIIADQLRVSVQCVANWERGDHKMTEQHFSELAALMKCATPMLKGMWTKWIKKRPDPPELKI